MRVIISVLAYLIFSTSSPQHHQAKAFAPSSMIRSTAVRVHVISPLWHPSSSSSSSSSSTTSSTTSTLHSSQDDEKDFMDVIQPWKVDIPEEYRDEIFRAEANTPAAKDRNQRVALYVAITFVGIVLSSMNVFLSGIRADAASSSDLSSIEDLGFGWAGSNSFTSFFLLNKIGGGLALISAGLGGTMVELEQRTKNENAENIWKELQRRRAEAEGGGSAKKARKKTNTSPTKKKKRKQKNRKRLDALSEVIWEDPEQGRTAAAPVRATSEQIPEGGPEVPSEQKEGLMDKMKNFYDKADQMAASQALLLNKELEEKGVVDKITDETGLKVIGKDAASKLKQKSSDDK
eukprot:CAMPEP_0197242392 /NCGR_PEP_ID=MMETSP1429-20130617/8160_1 /TAXON_ID=49237 /ORGANISM="Chaetoceros  sp., Strain UNC1202" /LENGTH=346 /DNA_ID=CAMNT_0042702421 /DNA_START=46 /DNA_END=1086 /DNA_ORIENTATION=+